MSILGSVGFDIRKNIKNWMKEYARMQEDAYTYDPQSRKIKCEGDVIIVDEKLNELPSYISFERVDGNFIWAGKSLTSMRGFPEVVGHNFICCSCPQSLDGLPKVIDLNFVGVKWNFSEKEVRDKCQVTLSCVLV